MTEKINNCRSKEYIGVSGLLVFHTRAIERSAEGEKKTNRKPTLIVTHTHTQITHHSLQSVVDFFGHFKLYANYKLIMCTKSTRSFAAGSHRATRYLLHCKLGTFFVCSDLSAQSNEYSN